MVDGPGRNGARPVGFDLSERQLARAVALRSRRGSPSRSSRPTPSGSRSATPASTWCSPTTGRSCSPTPTGPCPGGPVLRPGGLLAFTHLSPIYDIAFPPDADHAGERLVNDYFGLYRMQDMDGTVEFNLPYGAWIRLFRDAAWWSRTCSSPSPARRDQHLPRQDLAWSRRWPAGASGGCASLTPRRYHRAW